MVPHAHIAGADAEGPDHSGQNSICRQYSLRSPVTSAEASAKVSTIRKGPILDAIVAALACGPDHKFSKALAAQIVLRVGHGVEGDAHAGVKVKHRSRVAKDASQPNLRQVHLIAFELLDELRAGGFEVSPGALGENVTTRGLALIDLPRGARLLLGDEAVIEITGLRNPCKQLDGFQKGLMAATLDRDAQGGLIRKAGVMAIVIASGIVREGDQIRVELPPQPHAALTPV